MHKVAAALLLIPSIALAGGQPNGWMVVCNQATCVRHGFTFSRGDVINKLVWDNVSRLDMPPDVRLVPDDGTPRKSRN